MGKIMNFMKSKNKYILATMLLFLMVFGGTVYCGVNAEAATTGNESRLQDENWLGTVAKYKNGQLFYKASYKRVTAYYPFQSAWETVDKQNAMLSLESNQKTTTGSQMATAGFRYVDKAGNVNNNIKLYKHKSFETMNYVYSPGDMTLTDGTKVEYRYLGYTKEGFVVSNSFFLNDTVKDGNFPASGYKVQTISGTDITYKTPNVDYDAVRANMDLLSKNVGNSVVLDGKATEYNNNPYYAQKTFNTWFEKTNIGKNYLTYAINKGYTKDNAWSYWNQYLEIDGNIDEGSVFLYTTSKGGMNYRDYPVPAEASRNMVAHKIEIYDINDKRVGYGVRENTKYLYADSTDTQSYIELAKGARYTVKCTTKFLVKASESSKQSYTSSQTATLKAYYGSNIISEIASQDNIKYLSNGVGSITAVNPIYLGEKQDELYYWVTTEFETAYTVPRGTTADKGAFNLIIPACYQENGDNYEMLDDNLLVPFNIIDRMDMIMTDYNVTAGRRWKEGDTAPKERVWLEDINGNKIEEYMRNEPFYICYAYEQYTGEEDIVNPSIDATIYRAQSASVKKGTQVFDGMLTVRKTINAQSDPVIYKQLCFVEFVPTQDENTYIPEDALIMENTPYINVYAMISEKHTYEEQNNYWITSDDTCAGQMGECVMFAAVPADMEIIKVIFSDENSLEIKQDYTSTSNKPDENDTIGYYDREETVRIDYELDQTVYANINIPKPGVTRTIYQGVKNADGTISKYLDKDGNPVVLRSTGTVQSEKTLWFKDMGHGEDIVLATEYISTTVDALYIEYGVAQKHYLQRENDESDSWDEMDEKFVATISCTVADMELEKEIYLYDSKGNQSKNIPNLGETLTFGFNVLHVGKTKEQIMIVGGTTFNPYVTVNVKIIDNDKANGVITSYDQVPLNSPALIGAGNAVADTLLYPGQSIGWIPTLSVELPDVQLDVGNITVCGKIATVHDANLSNIVRNTNDEFCQVFKTERDFEITDLSYVPTKSVTADTELGFSVTVKSLGGAYNDKDVVLQPILTVYNYNYDTSSWDSIYRSQVNIANGEWVVTEINVPDFHISDNPSKPTRLRVAVNDRTNPSDWKYQEYVLKETNTALNNDPYQNNYKEITVTTKQPDLTICPECTVK